MCLFCFLPPGAAQLPSIGDDKELEEDEVRGDSSSSSSSSSEVAMNELDNMISATATSRPPPADTAALQEGEDEMNGNEESPVIVVGEAGSRYSNIEIGELDEAAVSQMSTSSSMDTLSELHSPAKVKVGVSEEKLNTVEEMTAQLDITQVIQPNQVRKGALPLNLMLSFSCLYY